MAIFVFLLFMTYFGVAIITLYNSPFQSSADT